MQPPQDRLEDVEVALLQLSDRALQLVVRGKGGNVRLVVCVPDATVSALSHLFGPSTPRCPVPPDAHVDLLLRSLLAADATARILVRREGSPAFRLRVQGHEGAVDLDLDVLDAVRLLISGQFPVLLEARGTGFDWDAALRTLTDPPA